MDKSDLKAMSFRLSEQARALLDALARHLGMTKTGVLEELIRARAQQENIGMTILDTTRDLWTPMSRSLGTDAVIRAYTQGHQPVYDTGHVEPDRHDVEIFRAWLRRFTVTEPEFLAIREEAKADHWDSITVGYEDGREARYYWWDVAHAEYRIVGTKEGGDCFAIPRTVTTIPYVHIA